MVLPIEPREPLRPGIGSDMTIIQLLKDWYKQFDDTNKEIIRQLSGYSMALLDFPIPPGFFNSVLAFWDHYRHILRLGDRELSPSLEEYAYLSGLELDKPCVQVNPGSMLDPFLTLLGFKQESIRPRLDKSYTLPIKFLRDRFASIQGFHEHIKEFQDNTKLEHWKQARVNAFIICLLSQVYFPRDFVRFDIGMAKVVMEMKEGRTVVPLILVESLRSLTTCKAYSGACFQGSFALLYIWTMGHLTPRPKSRTPSYCFKRDISDGYRARPKCCTNQHDWEIFFTSVTTEDVVFYTGWCSKSFLLKVPDYDFIPLVGLRGMIAYFPSAIATQFDRFQDVPTLHGGEEFLCKITTSKRRLLHIAYTSWEKRITSTWDLNEPKGKFSEEYLFWLEEQRHNWESRTKSDKADPLFEYQSDGSRIPTQRHQIVSLTNRVDELQNQLLSITAERDQAVFTINTLRDNINLITTQLRDRAPPGVDNSVMLHLLAWVHQNLNM